MVRIFGVFATIINLIYEFQYDNQITNMAKQSKKLVVRIFLIALMLNAIMPLYTPLANAKKEIEYKELSKILGKKVVICAGNLPNKHYISTFERLDQEQQQKLKKQIDVASSFPSSTDSKYINDVYSAHIAALHSGSIRPFSTSVKIENYQLSFKFSTAPPHIS